MSNNRSLRIAAEPLRYLDFSDISSLYVALGGPLENPAQMHSMVNMTNSNLVWSFDGIHDHGFLGANGGSFIFDLTTNKSEYQEGLYEAKGLQIYIGTDTNSAAVNPTSGGVYMTVLYSAQLSN